MPVSVPQFVFLILRGRELQRAQSAQGNPDTNQTRPRETDRLRDFRIARLLGSNHQNERPLVRSEQAVL
jgi:hypothetical protein